MFSIEMCLPFHRVCIADVKKSKLRDVSDSFSRCSITVFGTKFAAHVFYLENQSFSMLQGRITNSTSFGVRGMAF